jgi:GDP/UDP-N,N'-diacetylbacillosamine 2-epimerase (hydrolysing)
MGGFFMKKKIAVLTSSRADYGIYFPLLKLLKKSQNIDLKIIAFGTHLSQKHGFTLNNILEDGFIVNYTVDTLPHDDTPKWISLSMAKAMSGFAEIWGKENFDLIFALGDRYEMFAAVASTIPFNIKVAHIHGGETTTGAIDNVFRHSISLFSTLHFTSSSEYKKKLVQLLGTSRNVYNVGALSIDNLKKIKFLSFPEFKARFKVDLALPFMLITFNPETVGFEKNEIYINEIISALKQKTSYQFIVSMPNADTENQIIRKKWSEFQQENKNVHMFENLGMIGYLTSMKYCRLMLGNSSSGFIEASYFPKPVVNIGNRQKGRIITPNIIGCEARSESIIEAINRAERMTFDKPVKIYGTGNTASKIVSILKKNI